MAISIDESIRIFKAEIISQDHRLPVRRSEPLLEACACLKQRFNSRKNILAMLGMAEGVILYMRKREATADPDCLDFLKEALAHVVNVYEEGKFDPQREEELGRRMYKRFTSLKNRLKERPATPPTAPRTATEDGRAGSASQASPPPKPAATGYDVPPPPPAAPANEATTAVADHGNQPASAPEAKSAVGNGITKQSIAETAPLPPWERRRGNNRLHHYAPIPGEPCRLVELGDFPLLIPVNAIARLMPIKPRERQARLASTEVPLNAFGRLFRRLPRLFRGPLAKIPASRLKKLKLPLIMPRGGGLPTLPAEDADHLLVLSHGQWHGVVPVRLGNRNQLILQRFQTAANGDIAGLGTTDDDASYPLLNPRSLLEREGFLTMPEQG
ncbi:hypothetical protein [Desulfurivibrio dismutans]|uniref:hypothetical protein n=1 Tax=Desulfurivibrio dismutans TaxID=1398908 RepID=UPI0023DCA664|nr:hypothetical protein [Desulfurivibrio alkaliphilus]MDF1615397.1 hypothetical protein [Desulfurivibrio alkaliphilus]